MPEAASKQKAGWKDGDRRLELSMWMLAWDGYALAGAALEQVAHLSFGLY